MDVTEPVVESKKLPEPQVAVKFLNQALPRLQEMVKNYPGTTAGTAQQFKAAMVNVAFHGLVEQLEPILSETEEELTNLMINIVQAKAILLIAATKEQEVADQIKAENAKKAQGETNGSP